jgi:hypothetical protein
MKKCTFLFGLLLVLATSCTLFNNNDELGSITIALPSKAEARTLFGTGNPGGAASSATVAYGILLFDSANAMPERTTIVTSDSTSATISSIVPFTNYSVIVIAFGFSADGLPELTTNDAYVIGSGERKNISIVAGQNTSTTTSLTPMDLSGYCDSTQMRLRLAGTTGIDSLRFTSFYTEYPTTNPRVLTLRSILKINPSGYYIPSSMGGTFSEYVGIGCRSNINCIDGLITPVGETAVVLTFSDLYISESTYSKSLSNLWLTVPLPDGTSDTVTSADNTHGLGIGKYHFPVQPNDLFAFPFDGSPVNQVGGNLSENITWISGN